MPTRDEMLLVIKKNWIAMCEEDPGWAALLVDAVYADADDDEVEKDYYMNLSEPH